MFARKKRPEVSDQASSRKEDFEKKRKRELDAHARKVVRKAERLLRLAGEAERRKTTGWEDEFLAGVKERVETYGSAFSDPEKGAIGDPLSYKQTFKMAEISRSIHRRDREPHRRI